MKIKYHHLATLKASIAPLDTSERRAAYRCGNFPRADKVKDLDKRYRWDLFYTAGLSSWLCREVYPYADDTHVDTALRSIVPGLDSGPRLGA